MGTRLVNSFAAMRSSMFRKYLKLLIAITYLSVSLLGCIKTNAGDAEVSKEKVEALVKEELPLGTSRERVVAYLDKHKVEHSGNSAGAVPDTIYAIYRNAEGGTSVVKKSIQLTLRFKNDQLYNYDVKEMFTGP
ncbi:MAG: hypothetical protein ABI728_04365 [Betaproteobacteria bacterium]